MSGQMLWNGLDSECEKASAPVNWELGITDQSTAKNHQRKTHDKKTNPMRSRQIYKEHENLRHKHSNECSEQRAPMLQEFHPLIDVSVLSVLHSGQTLSVGNSGLIPRDFQVFFLTGKWRQHGLIPLKQRDGIL
jgi:hypothetical protein